MGEILGPSNRVAARLLSPQDSAAIEVSAGNARMRRARAQVNGGPNEVLIVSLFHEPGEHSVRKTLPHHEPVEVLVRKTLPHPSPLPLGEGELSTGGW
jgi:hypothetical protein